MTQENPLPKENIDARPGADENRIELAWVPETAENSGFVSLRTVDRNQFVMGEAVQGVSMTMSTMAPAFPVDLDRAGINRLIRSLRKARDSVFGRDE